jgi:hypothetical protein
MPVGLVAGLVGAAAGPAGEPFRTRKGGVEVTPFYLIGMGALMVAHGAWKWLAAVNRAEEHRRSINSGEERFYEFAARPANTARVEWWAKAEVIVGLLALAYGTLRFVTEGQG